MKIVIVAVFFFLYIMFAGACLANPRAEAEYTERTNASTVNLNQSNAQITQAQKADEEARRNAELLQSLQAQQAIVQGQAAIAQAQAQRDIAAINAAALVTVADQVAEASKPDNTLLIVTIIVGFATLGLIAYRLLGTIQTVTQAAQPVYQPQLPQPPIRTMIDVLDSGIPASVQRAAQQRGGVPMYNYEQARWQIVDQRDSTKVLATQRKQLTSKG